MFKEILTPGEKLKKIIKELKVTQQAIAHENFSPSYISLLINDKEEFNPSSAKVIANRINELAFKRGSKFRVSAEYFLESMADQVENITKKIIVEVPNATCKEELEAIIIELDYFLIKYREFLNDSLLYDLYVVSYKKLYDFKMYHECKSQVVKCIEIANKNNLDTSELILVMVRCCSLLDNHEDVITWGKTLKCDDKDSYAVKAINYNMAYAYKKLKKIDFCINHINNIKLKFNWSNSDCLRIEILYAECLRANNEIDNAIKIYTSLLEKIKNIESIYLKVLIYDNLSEIYMVNNNLNKALFYIKKAVILQDEDYEYNDQLKQYIYYDAFNIYMRNNDFNNFNTYFNKALEECKNNYNESLLIKIFDEMTEYCIKYNYSNLLFDLIFEAEKLIIARYIKSTEILKVFILAADYFKNIDMVKFECIFSMQLSIIKILQK